MPRPYAMVRRLVIGLLLLIGAAGIVGGAVAWYYVRKWEDIVSEKFRTHRWTFPSKIYSDSVLIYPGTDLKAMGFFDRLHDLGYQTVNGPVERNADYSSDDI